MDDPARKVRIERLWPLALAAILLGLVAPTARAQDDDGKVSLDEVARLFGEGAKLAKSVEELGGKVERDPNNPGKPIIGVDLSGTRVTDEDLASLKELMPEVHSLDLSNTKITDAGLDHLRRLFSLDTVTVGGTRVTEEGLADLGSALTHTRINRRPSSVKYFPDWSPQTFPEVFIDDRWAEDLYAMKEPSLLTLSKDSNKAVGYRLYWWDWPNSPLALRISPSGDGAILEATQLDTLGMLGGKPKLRKSVKLTRDQWARLKHRLDDSRFWSLPKTLWTSGLADGSVFFVEGVEGGKYHLVTSCTSINPDDQRRRFNALCEEMVRLSGLDLLERWKESATIQPRK